jgi:hypothetical protein
MMAQPRSLVPDQAIKASSGQPCLIAEMHMSKAAGDPTDDPPHAGGRRVHLTEEANLSLPAASAIAIAFFSFATSIPTNASL